MIVLETGFGDATEAFLENRISPGVNIIFSDDNNKGKTLVIQGLMYSMGNEPIFPSGFNHRNYMFYSKIESGGTEWSLLRKNNSMLVFSNGKILAFDSISEFKHYFHSTIHNLPIIKKDKSNKIADLALVFQLFFLPQDKRNTSNVFNSGYHKKPDFYELVYSLSGSHPVAMDETQIIEIKDEIAKLEEERKITDRRLKFSKSHPKIAEITHKSSDRKSFEAKRLVLESINRRISELGKDRTREINRKIKLEQLISELHSLNRDLSTGRVICADCGSNKVVFKNLDYSFDVSNQFVRNEVLGSIKNQIEIKKETISEFTQSLNYEQDQLNKELESTPKSLQTILLHSEEILSDVEIDNKLTEINQRIDELKRELNTSEKTKSDTKTANQNVIDVILKMMNSIYQDMDPNGRLFFDEIFTKKGETYSGSEEQEFYFAKIVALSNILNLDYPVIIDSFRDGELSSGKENYMIEKYLSLGKQVILSSTLKQEEYSSSKYSDFIGVNAIDYSVNNTSQILNTNYVSQFSDIIKRFNIVMENG
jgi:hypothetical protein